MKPSRTPAHTPERRKSPDWMVKGSTIFNVMAWLLTFTVLLLIDIAAPTRENMFSHYFNANERTVWNEVIILLAYITLILSTLSCLLATIFHLLRVRRKTDKYKISVFIISTVTILGLIVFMLRFSGQLF